MKIFGGIMVIMIAIVASIFFATISTSGQKDVSNEATVVFKGQPTDSEKEYSKEFRKLYPERAGKKLSDLSQLGIQKGWNKEIGVILGEPGLPSSSSVSPKTKSDLLKDWACAADLVVVGQVLEKKAHILDDETFVYTEYSLQITDIAKNNIFFPEELNKTIEVVRPGGLIKLDGQLINVEDKLYKELDIKRTYLLFLRYIPSTNGYLVSSSKSEFLMEGSDIKNLSSKALTKTFESKDNQTSVITQIRNVATPGCMSAGEEN